MLIRYGVAMVVGVPSDFNNGTFGCIRSLHRQRGHNQCLGVDFTPTRGKEIAGAFDMKA